MDRRFVKTNDSSYMYDEESSSVINTDDNEWMRFKSERDRIMKVDQMQQQIDQLMIRIATLEEKVLNG